MIDSKEIKNFVSHIEVLMTNGHFKKAYDELLNLKSVLPDNFIVQYYECKLLSLKKEYYEAIKVAKNLTKNYGGNKDLLYLLSDIYLKMDDLDSSLEYINIYREVAPFDFALEVLEKRCEELKFKIIKGDTKRQTPLNEEEIDKREFASTFSKQEDKNENTSELEAFCGAFGAVEDPGVVKKSLKEFLDEPILKEETARLGIKQQVQTFIKEGEEKVNKEEDNEVDNNFIPLEKAGFVEKDNKVEKENEVDDNYSKNLGFDIEEKEKLRAELDKHDLLEQGKANDDENDLKEEVKPLNVEEDFDFIDMEIKAKDYLRQKDYIEALACYEKLYEHKKSDNYSNNIEILRKVILQIRKSENLSVINEKYSYLREEKNV